MKNRPAVLFLMAVSVACLPALVAAQWVKTNGPEGCHVLALAVDGARIFASVEGHGVYGSSDEGGRWAAVDTGMLSARDVTCLEVWERKLFAGTEDGFVGYSTDGGVSWERIRIRKAGGSYSHAVTGFALIGTDLIVGTLGRLYVCPDYALGNEASPLDLPKMGGLSSLAVVGTDVFVGSAWGGAWLVRRLGEDWTASELPFPKSSDVQCLEASGSVLYAGGGGGIFLSSSGGASWIRLGADFRDDATLSCLAIDGPDLLAGFSYEESPNGPACARLSRDGGKKWRTSELGLKNVVVRCFVTAGKALLAGTSNGIYLSRDGGATWKPTGPGLPVASRVAFLAAMGKDLFAGTTHGDRSYRRSQYGGLQASSNEGRTWRAADKGLPSSSTAVCLAVAGTDLFAGLSDYRWEGDGVYRSPDNGRTWLSVNSDLPPRSSVEHLAVIGRRIYADVGGRIFVSSDNGAVWTALDEGLPEHWFSCLVAAGEDLFVGVRDYRWAPPAAKGPSLTSVVSLSAGGQLLFAGGPPPAGGLSVLAKGGGKWKGTGVRLSRVINDLARIGTRLFLGTGNGLYVCENYLVSPKALKLKLGIDVSVESLAVVGTDLYIGTDEGVWLVRSDGKGWTVVHTGLPGGIGVSRLVVSGPDLYAGTEGSGVWRYPLRR